MYSSDGRLSLQSLSEFESSRSWTAEAVFSAPTSSPQQLQQHQLAETSSSSQDNNADDGNPCYMGISLPRKLTAIFPELTPSDVLLDKTNKSRPNYESRRAQVTIPKPKSYAFQSESVISVASRKYWISPLFEIPRKREKC